jgi:hypothetical protein
MVKKKGKKVVKRTAKTSSTKKTAAQKTPRKPTVTTVAKPRRLKPATYKSLRLQKRIKHPAQLPNVWRLTITTARLIWRHKWLFGGITLLYGLTYLILVQGLSNGTDVNSLKGELNKVFTGHLGSLASGLSVFVVLLSSAGSSTSPTAGTYQVLLALLASLAVIWALRQLAAGVTFRVRDAYYRGMYPLIPFVLVLLVVGLQLIPLLVGSTLYGIVSTNGIAVYFVEKLLWALLFVLCTLLTLYMLSSSLFALYIVTLPDMTPMKALRSARQLSRYRRWTVLRKIVWLPIILLIAAAIIMLPIIIWLTFLAQWVFFLLTMFSVVAVHAYMYTLYRELLNE